MALGFELKNELEQGIWKQIEELKEKQKNSSKQEAQKIEQKIDLLLKELAVLQGPEYSDLEEENTKLKKSLSGMKEELNELKLKYNELRKTLGAIGTEQPFEQAQKPECDLQLRLYKALLEKYSEIINESEKKTVGEIKALINKEDLTIQMLVAEFLPEGYSFEEHFLSTAEQLYSHLVREIDFVKTNIELNFWLSPKEVLENRLADDEDFAVLLCTCLHAMGDQNAEVVIAELEDLKTHAIVLTEIQGKFLLLDPSQKAGFKQFFGNKEEIMNSYSFEGSKIKRFLYKFNAKNYESFL